MKRSKLIFLIIAILFFVILAIIAFDIANRTTFPGKKPAAPATEQTN
jgi:Flp pilus assembly protein CpaB